MWILPACILCLALYATPAWTDNPQCNGDNVWNTQRLTDADKTAILVKHNKLRELIASGAEKAKGWPKANNMMRLTWNDSLADAARAHSNECVFVHSRPANTKMKTEHYGQNLAIDWDSDKANISVPHWADFIQAWYNEIDKLIPTQRYPYVGKEGCGHFTQLIWAESSQVGCSWTQYTDASPPTGYPNNTALYTCNYSPPGNSVAKNDPELAATLNIYQERMDNDTACSGCPRCYVNGYPDLCGQRPATPKTTS